ncbi:hypothetical protein SDC9_140032 [bioreactor metagenome]|uniref:DUF3037 domain-containing protein n=1 Tax=bioreactor metagenome TaxID=1076179 RepID=A0A645DU73_9ZZZZ
MSGRVSYSYSILRYVHDISTGEFVNVGVVMYSRDADFIKFKGKITTGRISGLFPTLKVSQYKSLMKLICSRFKVIEKESASGLGFAREINSVSSLEEILSKSLPRDDGSLVWSGVSSGASENLETSFEKIYARFVTRFDSKQQAHGRSDDDVLRGFKRDLERRNLLSFFEPKKIAGHDDEFEFPVAWKNGIWHCVEPVSFDLSASESIREKAHKCLGQITSIADAEEKFKLYLVVAKPRDEALQAAYERAIHILDKIPAAKEIITEDQTDKLAEEFSSRISLGASSENKTGLLDLNEMH